MFGVLLIIIILLAGNAHAQDQCPRITVEDLGSTRDMSSDGLLVRTYNRNINPTSPTIRIHDYNIVCLSNGVARDTYEFVSVVVNQTCSGLRCEMQDRAYLVQYDFQCVDDEWTETVFSAVSRTDSPSADLRTALRGDCSACTTQIADSDEETHCTGKLIVLAHFLPLKLMNINFIIPG